MFADICKLFWLYPFVLKVKEAQSLHKKLAYMNEHQNCIIADYKKEVELLREQLNQARIKLDSCPADIQKLLNENGLKTSVLEKQIKEVGYQYP